MRSISLMLRAVCLWAAFAAITANAATLSEAPASAPRGSSVTATWSGIAAPTATDWIGLYIPGAANTSYVSFRYTTGAASGSVPFTIPSTVAAGTYELRVFANNGYTLLATSNSFTVVLPSLSESPSIVSAGATITASWSNVGAPSATDWIGLYTPTAADTAFMTFQYTTGTSSGQMSFNVPASTAAGTYQLRLFSNNSYTRLATSGNFTVGWIVSGTVTTGNGSPLAGVVIAATGGVTCTSSNASGGYSCTVPQGWSGTVTPSLGGYAFSPASRNYTNVAGSQASQDFTAAAVYRIGGAVTLNGSPLSGVAFSGTNGATCTSSDASGLYTCSILAGWSGTITPSLGGYTFTPISHSYADVTSSLAGDNFAATTATASNRIFFVHVDHLNTPRLVANAAGTSVWKWDQQEAFGDNIADEDPDGDTVAFQFPLRLPGQYFDKETNAHYNYFRDCYVPWLGRYCQSDPIGLRGGQNTYSYVTANPLRFVDPLGLVRPGETSIESIIESSVMRGEARNLQTLIESGALTPGEEAAVQAGIREIEILQNSTGNTGRLAELLNRSKKEIERAIHACKRNLPKSAPKRNPDVVVDARTGEVYPKLDSGRIGDSIGNILDYLLP